MAFQRPTLAELVERISADFTSRLSLTGAVLRRSVIHVLSRVVAGAAHMLHGHIEFLSRQIFPDQSEAEFLVRHASLFGLTRTPATFATGNVTLTGSNGAVVPEGTVLQRADGRQYATTADATIASGTATVEVEALTAGEAGNALVGVTLTFVSPVAGVSATAAVATGGLTAGTDEEADDALRARLLERMREPPHGGSRTDYIGWAKEVSGVTRVWVYPEELGAGTVTVRFVRDNDASIIPDAGEVADVQNHIDERRPVTAEVTVAAPVAAPLDFTIDISPDTTAVRQAVEAELRDLLAREAVPGGTILISRIREAISIAAGEADNALTSPSANVTHTAGQIAVMGTITWA